ncbi:MAG: hypothetical protein GY702_17050 [Desulfobulbaceae bacterium]|nr:hypothetical protein [Desulfobulbaceae bacterium]
MKELFLSKALQQISVILTLQDRNPHSPTFGCFDRNYWHYKIIDFPSGMAQEFVYPLALAYHAKVEGNIFYKQEGLRQWIEAGILYAAASGHTNGACDDYFPFECAGGAAAFSLLACMESYSLMGFDNQPMLDFFAKRADWLAGHHESGRLSNHQALIVLCLERAGSILATDKWDEEKQQRLDKLLSWQSEEGWFYEYEGCDTGYLTLTLGCLAQYYDCRPDDLVRDSIERGVNFVSEFVHSDGSFGGEYTSRNTYNYFPHGFELIGRWMPSALTINDRFLTGLQGDLGPAYGDDHIIGHHTWSYLLAWKSFIDERPEKLSPPKGRTWFKEAGLLIDRTNGSELYIALNKGGVFKLFDGNRLICSDTQFSFKVKQGEKVRNAVAHLAGAYQVEVEENKIVIRGEFGWAKQKQMTTFNLIVLRLIMYCGGRLFPDLVRKLLQKVLITGKKNAPLKFVRTFHKDESGWIVEDVVNAPWANIVEGGLGGHQTSIYVVMSRTFQDGQLQPWKDYSHEISQLKDDQVFELKRTF